MSGPRRVIAITGAGGTLGAALSRQFVCEPDTDVVLSDVSASSLDATVDGLSERRGAVETLLADVGDVADVDAVVGLAVERFGRLDVLISNAGVLSPNGRIHNVATEDWELALRVNVLGAVNGIRAAVPVMRTQQSGSIILTASVAGLTAWSHAAPYCATKAAVIQLAKVAAVEYAREGYGSTACAPGRSVRGSTGTSRRTLSTRSRPGIRSGSEPPPISWARTRIRERRLALDDGIGDRGRRRLRGAVGGRHGVPERRCAVNVADQSTRSTGVEYPASSLMVAQFCATSSIVGCPPAWT